MPEERPQQAVMSALFSQLSTVVVPVPAPVQNAAMPPTIAPVAPFFVLAPAPALIAALFTREVRQTELSELQA